MRSEAFCRPDVFSVFSTVRHFLLNQLTWRKEDLVNLSKLMLQLRPTVERSGSLVPASYHRKPAILDKSLPLIREYSSGSFAAEKRIQASASAWSRASFPGQRSVTEAHPRRLAGADSTNSSRIYFPCSADNTFKSSLSSLSFSGGLCPSGHRLGTVKLKSHAHSLLPGYLSLPAHPAIISRSVRPSPKLESGLEHLSQQGK